MAEGRRLSRLPDRTPDRRPSRFHKLAPYRADVPNNALVTGPPRSGKTTAIERTVDRLEARGLTAGGLYCPELRSGGKRVGFEIRDILTGEADVLAHVDRTSGPSVGKYRVDMEAVDELCAGAFPRAFGEADVVVVDEIAPMQVYSDEFVEGVRRALDAEEPLLAAIQYGSESGFIGEVKSRGDADTFEVTEANRDELPERLAARIAGWDP